MHGHRLPEVHSKLAVSAALCGAAGLLLLSTGVAWADPGSSSPSSSSSSSGSSGSSAPGSNLGGFTLSSSAAGISVDYEQPNFPIPETPSAELDLGWSSASYDAGPVGTANAASIWFGPIATAGSELPLLVDPYLQEYFGPLASTLEPLVPTGLSDPVQAQSAYPQGPTTASNNNGPMSMDSSADENGSTGSSSLALVGGPSAQSSLPAGMLTIQSAASTSQDTIDNLGNAVSEATSTAHGIDLFGGIVQIGAVSSTATSSSDGNNATLAGSSTVTDATVAGEPVSVSSSGVNAVGNGEDPLASAPNVNQILSQAGITMAVTNPTDSVSNTGGSASGQRTLQGLVVTINLATYDQDYSQLVSELPSQLTSGLAQLPVPTPYKQTITLQIGWAQVNAAASPPYNLSLGSTPDDSTGSSVGGLGSTGTGGGSFPSGGTGLGTGAGGPGTAGLSPSTAAATIPNAAPVALFKGVGTGLIVLGLVLAALLAALLVGADRAVGRLAAAPCVGEHTGDVG
ncbi:MAG TPA: choice-of-anchor P family protein [Acidimicrobiales bacterium]|nr:choice-of-anchor P family protein [Acidimicrobiales bacterium]